MVEAARAEAFLPAASQNGVTLREAMTADLTSISRIEQASFPDDPWTPTMLAETVASPDSPVWVAERRAEPHEAEMLGFAAVLAARGASDADVLTIAVDAAARGLGIGRRLLTALATTAKARGAHQLFLEVRAGNSVARGLYESEGFGVIGTRPRYYQPDGEDATVMRLDLHRWAAARGLSSAGAHAAGPTAAQPTDRDEAVNQTVSRLGVSND
ncbi:ribosomal protein S18-alanine N-acetyltransferase [Pseudoclavibacter sp. CFCC 11306]|uniref:ribosomal protein S18-alanine N-acetyltransferase n=1 Tax=Pseudoclavibacter sp. CFCC 11306 TaxID=1564493 RepID=UPI001CE465EA|nr:ribosomal protein S18-alanine N-acetyltransferase [Pseudoclavibacter sp. CFCC 11306]